MADGTTLGPEGRIFGEPTPTGQPRGFFVRTDDEQYYKLVNRDEVQQVPTPRRRPVMRLDEVLPRTQVQQIQNSGKIVFHAAGDTGPARGGANQEDIVRRMEVDFHQTPAAPAFFYHLGDVVYNFGEPDYYYEQFYEPYRNYAAPIFAIPGNHDGVIYDGDPVPTLYAFLANFCADRADRSVNAGGLSRTAMTQPGVYYTLEAPPVAIVGLYSNVLEGPGVISDEGGRYTQLDDRQVRFLTDQLTGLKARRNSGEIAGVILAVHHPLLSADNLKPGSEAMLNDIDGAVQQAGLIPDAVLSGHAHNYQRFLRNWSIPGGPSATVPFIIAGSGGHNAQDLKPDRNTGEKPEPPITLGDHVWDTFYPYYGYLRVIVDAQAKQLTLEFNAVDRHAPANLQQTTVVDLQKRTVSTK